MQKFNESNVFQGCFASDDIQPIKPNTVTVYNTENGNNNYGHWTALFTSPQIHSDSKTCFYFDPLGCLPQNSQIVERVLNYSQKFYYNNVQFQSIFSQLCALHIVFVSALYCQGVSVNDILNKYYNPSTNQEFINDKIVFYALLPDLKKLEGGENISEFTLNLPFFSSVRHDES